MTPGWAVFVTPRLTFTAHLPEGDLPAGAPLDSGGCIPSSFI